MAPTILASDDVGLHSLVARQYYRNCRHYSNGRCYSSWSWYGRWIFAAVLIGICILLFFILACLNSRRRRRRGLRPVYGTGWMAPNTAPYYNNPQGYNQPPPAYGAPPGQSYPMNPQPTGQTFQTADGYYAQHDGIQPPKNVYAPANPNDDYAPPPGPPPTQRPNY